LKQARFARLYYSDPQHVASKAAVSAGYSPNGAAQTANKLLKLPYVRAMLESFERKAVEKFELTAGRVLRELSLMGYANMQDFVQDGSFVGVDALTRDQAAAIQELTFDADGGTKVKLANKREALELLGKHLKLFGADDHGAGAAVRVIIVDVTRPGRPAVGVAGPEGQAVIDVAPTPALSPGNDTPALPEDGQDKPEPAR
jgi:phage terminase small subunit